MRKKRRVWGLNFENPDPAWKGPKKHVHPSIHTVPEWLLNYIGWPEYEANLKLPYPEHLIPKRKK